MPNGECGCQQRAGVCRERAPTREVDFLVGCLRHRLGALPQGILIDQWWKIGRRAFPLLGAASRSHAKGVARAKATADAGRLKIGKRIERAAGDRTSASEHLQRLSIGQTIARTSIEIRPFVRYELNVPARGWTRECLPHRWRRCRRARSTGHRSCRPRPTGGGRHTSGSHPAERGNDHRHQPGASTATHAGYCPVILWHV